MIRKCRREHRCIIDQFNQDDLLILPNSKLAHFEGDDTERRRAPHQGRSSKIRPGRKSTKRCNFESCQLCNSRSMEVAKRQREGLIPSFHDESSVAKRKKILTDNECFEAEDPFEIGIISKAKFESLLIQLWKRIGHPLPELESIVNTFSCGNGFINYVSFLNFAAQQSMPCSIHGRFLCTSPKCVHKIYNREKFCERLSLSSPSSRNISECGKYISRYQIVPKSKIIPTTKRGLNIFSQDDMKRAFVRQTLPDVKSAIHFRSLTSVMVRFLLCSWAN